MKTFFTIALFVTSATSFIPGNWTNDLSKAEKEGIQWMREEEKLAHDVYQFLNEIWEINVFSNISGAEIRHFNAIGYLVESFELEDPAFEESGRFRSQELQSLYDSLTTRGSESLVAAVQVGAYIEELDIQDLKQLIDKTENETILPVYQNLLRASGNHLRAFTTQLANRNQSYVPSILSVADYQAILETPHQGGMGNCNCMMQNNCVNCNAPGKGRQYRGGRGNK